MRDLIEGVYLALRTGDRDGLRSLLADDFQGRMAEGMPAAGGLHRGAEAAIRDGWWTLGKHYAVYADPAEWIDTADGRLLVSGTYRGRVRATGEEFEAAFTHLWTARDGKVAGVVQVTDTARWPAPA